MIIALSIFLALQAIFAPVKKAFGILLIGSMLGVTPNGVDVSAYLMIILFLRSIVIGDIFTRGKLLINAIGRFYLFLLIISLLSFLFFSTTVAGRELVMAYIRITFVLFLAFKLIQSEDDLVFFIPYVWAAFVLIVLHVYLQFLGLHPFSDLVLTKWGRLVPNDLSNNYTNSNTYAAYISWTLGILIGYYKAFKKSSFTKRQNLRINLLIVTAFLVTLPVLGALGSRSNIGLLILAFILTQFNFNLKRVLIFGPLVLFLFFTVSIKDLVLGNDIPFLGESTNARIDNVFEEFSEETNNSRLSLLKAGFYVFLENPIFGVGVGNELIEIEKRTGVFNVSHNTYINLISELGLLGLLGLIWFFRIWRGFLASKLFIIFFTILILDGFFHEIKAMTFTWVTIYLFWLMMQIERQRKVANYQFN